jgi:hypothetical protein
VPKNTVIFDLDGTLALIEHRRHFVEKPKEDQDWDRFYDACDKDIVNHPVLAIFQAMAPHYHTVILTGRSDIVREKTETWLADHKIYYDQLVMRTHGDRTSDHTLKRDWVRGFGPEKILVVFEDRARVVKMWREMGLACMHVAEGEF